MNASPPTRRIFLTATAATLAHAAIARPKPTLLFAVVPQFAPEEIFEHWNPVLHEIERLAEIKLSLITHWNIPEFERSVLKGVPDFAYMNPYHAVMAHQAHAYQPIVRDGELVLKGILVVRQDSPLRELRELDGATLVFPSPNAFGASLYMRALLARTHGLKFKPVYVGTHSNVYRHVIAGKATAGGGVISTLQLENPVIRQQLRVLFETPPSAPHPVMAHPRVTRGVVNAVKSAWLALGANPAKAAQLRSIQISKPVMASVADYAPLHELDLDQFVVVQTP